MLQDLPVHIKGNQSSTEGYLRHGLKLGLAAMAQAAVSLNTTEYLESIRREFDDFTRNLDEIKNRNNLELEQLIEQELTGENSSLACELKDYLAENGRFANTLNDLRQRLSDPTNLESIPHKVNTLLVDTFERADSPFRKALSIADKNSPLYQILDQQRQELANHKMAVVQLHSTLKQEMQTQFEVIKTGLNIQDLLKQKEIEQVQLFEKSGQKGKPFEAEIVEVLERVTRYNRDSVINLGDVLVDGTRRKVGDVLIEIHEEICNSLRVIAEVKSGNYNLEGKDGMVKQILEAMQFRKAQGGIGVVQRKYAKTKQPVYSERGSNIVIVIVDPENEESGFLPLEVAYMALRTRLLTQSSKSGSLQIDFSAAEQTIAQITNCLNSAQSMKNNCTAAKNSIDRTYTDLQQMEAAIKQQLATLRLQLGLS